MGTKFKVGDVVQLKSGGPNMTVSCVLDEGFMIPRSVVTDWFDENNRICHESFAPDSLKLWEVPRA